MRIFYTTTMTYIWRKNFGSTKKFSIGNDKQCFNYVDSKKYLGTLYRQNYTIISMFIYWNLIYRFFFIIHLSLITRFSLFLCDHLSFYCAIVPYIFFYFCYKLMRLFPCSLSISPNILGMKSRWLLKNWTLSYNKQPGVLDLFIMYLIFLFLRIFRFFEVWIEVQLTYIRPAFFQFRFWWMKKIHSQIF